MKRLIILSALIACPSLPHAVSAQSLKVQSSRPGAILPDGGSVVSFHGEGIDDTTAFVGGEKEEEEEDQSQKELGSCQG